MAEIEPPTVAGAVWVCRDPSGSTRVEKMLPYPSVHAITKCVPSVATAGAVLVSASRETRKDDGSRGAPSAPMRRAHTR